MHSQRAVGPKGPLRSDLLSWQVWDVECPWELQSHRRLRASELEPCPALTPLGKKVGVKFTAKWGCFLFLFAFCVFRATPVAYRGSQARGQIRAVAGSLHTPQLTAKPDP